MSSYEGDTVAAWHFVRYSDAEVESIDNRKEQDPIY